MKAITFIAFAMIVLIASSSASFAIPEKPNQFWGTVTINGAPAPDGTAITSKIDGVSTESTTTSGGSYSLILTDQNSVNSGKTVVLYVSGVQAATDFFVNGGVTELNLAVTVSTPSSPPGGTSGGSSSGGGGSVPPSSQPQSNVSSGTNTNTSSTTTSSDVCRERWTCKAWTECNGGVQIRTCKDVNNCGTARDMPMTEQPCTETTVASGSSSTTQSGAEKSNLLSGMALSSTTTAMGAGALVLIIIVGYVIFSRRKKANSTGFQPVK